jgi:hypothetical protein
MSKKTPKPDVTDPELDVFIARAEGRDGRDEITRVAPNPERVRVIRAVFDRAVYSLTNTYSDILYLEMLIALAEVFCSTTQRMLHAADLDTFELNREPVLNLLGVMSVIINEITPTPEQLREAAISPTLH